MLKQHWNVANSGVCRTVSASPSSEGHTLLGINIFYFQYYPFEFIHRYQHWFWATSLYLPREGAISNHLFGQGGRERIRTNLFASTPAGASSRHWLPTSTNWWWWWLCNWTGSAAVVPVFLRNATFTCFISSSSRWPVWRNWSVWNQFNSKPRISAISWRKISCHNHLHCWWWWDYCN